MKKVETGKKALSDSEGGVSDNLKLIRLSDGEAARIQKAAETAKTLKNSTVILIFRNGRFERADVNEHHSRVA